MLHIAARNAGEYTIPDLLVVLATVLAFFVAVQLILTLLFRREPQYAAAATALLVGVFFLFEFTMGLVRQYITWRGGSPPYSLIATFIGTTILLVLLYRVRHRLDRATQFLSVAAPILVVWSGVLTVTRHAAASGEIDASALAAEWASPVPVRGDAGEGGPDIYVIVADEYANADVLAEFFEYDNRPFEDSLRGLGFTVPDVVQSNYSMTLLSMASFLNFGHVTPLTRELGEDARAPLLPYHLIEHNRTVRFLKERGYRFVFFPNPWWPGTLYNRHADTNFQVPGDGLRNVARRTHLRRVLWGRTFMPHLFPDRGGDARHIASSLQGLAEVAADPRPTFAFAHLMSPHPPYAFREDCRPRVGAPTEEDIDVKNRRAYVTQVRCLNDLLLASIRQILDRSDSPPVIIVQADHGSATQRPATTPLDEATASVFRERFGAFGAYHLPGAGPDVIGDTVTAVNVLRGVLRHYFLADLPPLPDARYFSILARPYDMLPVDPQPVSASR